MATATAERVGERLTILARRVAEVGREVGEAVLARREAANKPVHRQETPKFRDDYLAYAEYVLIREGFIEGERHRPVKLQPLGDRLIVEILEEEQTTASGIVLPDTAKGKPQRGRVLAVGPGGRHIHTGELMPLDVIEGDEIIFSKYGGTAVNVEGEDVMILRESDVLAKLPGLHNPEAHADHVAT